MNDQVVIALLFFSCSLFLTLGAYLVAQSERIAEAKGAERGFMQGERAGYERGHMAGHVEGYRDALPKREPDGRFKRRMQ